KRHLELDHEFVCLSDRDKGFRHDIRLLGLPKAGARTSDPMALKRIWMFSEEAGEVIGPRFINIDLDTVIVGDITPLLSRTEDFVVWKAPFYDARHHSINGPPYCYNASLMMMNAGARAFVRERFAENPEREIQYAEHSGWVYHGDSDIVSNMLIPREATWDLSDGLYAYWTHLDCGDKPLPADARIVSFYGPRCDPADPKTQQKSPWIKEHWRQ
ncbi:MAG TPA: hypothetical protein VFK30_16750, partial [Anaerolineae bacterium]|nr:hypothetical protein [Anaerolineae bacterium]